MAEDRTTGMPQQSVLYLLVCLAGLLLFIAVGPYATWRKAGNLDQRIGQTRAKIAEQEMLLPRYAQMKARLDATPPPPLAVPEPEPFPGGHPQHMRRALYALAQASGITPEEAAFELDTIGGGSEYVVVSFQASGRFAAFRTFLMNLLETPYVERILDFRILETPEGRELRARLRLLRSGVPTRGDE